MDNIYLKITNNLEEVVGNATTYTYGGIDMSKSVGSFIDDKKTPKVGYVIYNGTRESLEGTSTIEITKEEYQTAYDAYSAVIGEEQSQGGPLQERIIELERQNAELRVSQADQDELIMTALLGGN
ncbi:hypothetical protein V2H29_09995 [Lysinibacillus fusiformis]|uniref:Uncharacterized protein n=1 Tax=Lysinibacillus fusiformis TaxID=28031 RepID=A0A2I0V409_9BACI|nr:MULTISPECIES: hypothetical protein [Lysinibacillus]MEE3807282.1 hypothetical protein [Lysinibacillus fusiformis]PKU53037.1 hypothetical protein CRI88_01520 [Lysinibacillus fusiformis]